MNTSMTAPADLTSTVYLNFLDPHPEEKGLYSAVDERKNLHDLENVEIKAIVEKQALAIACLIEDKYLTSKDNGYLLQNLSLKDRAPNIYKGFLRQNEAFENEPSVGFGTAFLVESKKSNLVLTAAHNICYPNTNVENLDKIQKTCLVFGFKMKNAQECELQVSHESVFRIKKSVYHLKVDKGADWALLKLDRSVKGITPLEIDFTSSLKLSQNVYMLGHPIGLPLKYVGNAQIVSNVVKESFEARLAAFKGNSGSPVFDMSTKKVIGMLVSGNNDFDYKKGEQFLSLHVVTKDDIQKYGYEHCQRMSALDLKIIKEINAKEYKQIKENQEIFTKRENHEHAVDGYNKGVENLIHGKQEEAMRHFETAGKEGIAEGYVAAALFSRVLDSAKEYLSKAKELGSKDAIELLQRLSKIPVSQSLKEELRPNTADASNSILIGSRQVTIASQNSSAYSSNTTMIQSNQFTEASDHGKADARNCVLIGSLQITAANKNNTAVSRGSMLADAEQYTIKIDTGDNPLLLQFMELIKERKEKVNKE